MRRLVSIGIVLVAFIVLIGVYLEGGKPSIQEIEKQFKIMHPDWTVRAILPESADVGAWIVKIHYSSAPTGPIREERWQYSQVGEWRLTNIRPDGGKWENVPAN